MGIGYMTLWGFRAKSGVGKCRECGVKNHNQN